MRNVKWSGAILFLTLWASPPTQAADSVETTTGMRFTGKITRQSAEEIAIIAWGNEVKLKMTKVHAITRDGTRKVINPRKARTKRTTAKPKRRKPVRTVTRTPAKPKKLTFMDQLKKNGALPPWVKTHTVAYDFGTPWKTARKDIRTKLANQQNKDAIRMTYIYAFEKPGSPGKGEWALYLLLGAQPLQSYRAYMQEKPTPWGNMFMSGIAWGYQDFKRAEMHLRKSIELPRKYTGTRADCHIKLGDLYAELGNAQKARQEYQAAIQLTQNTKTFPPWGAKEYMRRRQRARDHMDLLSMRKLNLSGVRDGKYSANAQGYSGMVNLTLTVSGRKITNITVTNHQEKIDQNSTKLIPKKIVETQQLTVDAITGATVTTDAIKVAVFNALKKGGLK